MTSPQHTLPPTVWIYIHQRNMGRRGGRGGWGGHGRGRGLQQHMHTTSESNSDGNSKNKDPLPHPHRSKPKPVSRAHIFLFCFNNQKYSPPPGLLSFQRSFPPTPEPHKITGHSCWFSIQLYNIHAQKNKKTKQSWEKTKAHLVFNRRCGTLVFYEHQEHLKHT